MEGKRNGKVSRGYSIPFASRTAMQAKPANSKAMNHRAMLDVALMTFMLMPWMLARFLLIYSSLRRTGACEAHKAEPCSLPKSKIWR